MKELDHPYVLRMDYSFQTPDYLHMVMELCEHGDLAQQLDVPESNFMNMENCLIDTKLKNTMRRPGRMFPG